MWLGLFVMFALQLLRGFQLVSFELAKAYSCSYFIVGFYVLPVITVIFFIISIVDLVHRKERSFNYISFVLSVALLLIVAFLIGMTEAGRYCF